MKTFTFNNITNDYVVVLQGSIRPAWAPIEREFTEILDRPGAYLFGSSTKARQISIPILIKSTDLTNLQQLKEDIAEWLILDKPAPLVFDDEPDRTYYAVVDGSLDIEEIVRWGQGTITFICPEPYKYGEEINQDISEDPVVINESSAETKPKFTLTFNQPATHFEIINTTIQDAQGASPSIVLGQPASLVQSEIEPLELILHDTMQSTANWQTASSVDNGYIAGEMAANKDGFYALRVGEEIKPNNWQGPSLIKGFDTTLQDFRAEILFKQFNSSYQTGMLEIYFRDANQNIVAKLGFEDVFKTRALNQAKFQLGGLNNRYSRYIKADYQRGWNDFDGIMRIERVENVWRLYFAKIRADGTHTWVSSTIRYTDAKGEYMAPIKYIQVAIRLWPLTKPTDMSIHEIKVFKINQPQTEQEVPYIADVGDVIEIDCETSSIRKNGESQLYLADLQTQFFPIAKGVNWLRLSPDGAATVEINYKKKYL